MGVFSGTRLSYESVVREIVRAREGATVPLKEELTTYNTEKKKIIPRLIWVKLNVRWEKWVFVVLMVQ